MPAKKEGASKGQPKGLPLDILEQEIPITEIYVRRGTAKPNKFGRYRCLAYVEWPTIRRILNQADPNWSIRAVDTRMGDPAYTVQDSKGYTKLQTPDVHFYAVRELTVCGVTRSGTGEDSRSPKAAATDACKRAAYQFGVAQQLFSDEWYQKVGLPGMQFFCEWPDEYATHVSLADILNGQRDQYKPGDYRGPIAPAKKPASPKKRDLKKDALVQAAHAAKQLGLVPEDVKALIQAEFGKESSAELSEDEARELRDLLMGFESRDEFADYLRGKLNEMVGVSSEQ